MRQRFAIFCGTLGITFLAAASALGTCTHAGPTPASRGADLFAAKGCAHCHGDAGVGGQIGPDLQHVREHMDAATIAKQIREGGGSMPAFGEILTPAETDDIVAYLRAKRKFVKVPAKSPAANAI